MRWLLFLSVLVRRCTLVILLSYLSEIVPFCAADALNIFTYSSHSASSRIQRIGFVDNTTLIYSPYHLCTLYIKTYCFRSSSTAESFIFLTGHRTINNDFRLMVKESHVSLKHLSRLQYCPPFMGLTKRRSLQTRP